MRKEHFVFNCAYFDLNFEFAEVMELFALLDKKSLGFLDENQFANIFEGVADTWNSHIHDITKSVLRHRKGDSMPQGDYQTIDISLAANTLDKFAPSQEEMHGYPHFFKKVRNKLGRNDTQSQRTKQRTLSIVDKEGKVIPQDPCKELMRSEYDAHFTKKNSINNHPDFILMKQ